MSVEVRRGGAATIESPKSANGGTSSKKRDLSAAEKRKEREQQRRMAVAQRLAAAAAELANGVQEAKVAVETLDNSMHGIASASQQAASAAHQSLKNSEVVEQKARNAGSLAAETLEKVNLLKSLVASSTDEIRKLIGGVNRAAATNLESAQYIADLQRQSAEIGQIVATVEQIADQTNLLAFNAAIEAARAGRHGVGFAVVADEVRTLAETTATAAKEIKELISTIQEDVQQVANDVAKIGSDATAEVEKGKNISSSLESIAGEMNQTVINSQRIRDQAAEAAKAASEMRQGAQQVSAAAEQASTATRQASQAVAEQARALGEITGAAEDLAQMADELRFTAEAGKAGQEVSSAATELSATIQQSNSAAQQIMTAVQQINASAQHQSAAAQQSLAGAKQIEANARVMLENATSMEGDMKRLSDLLETNKVDVDNFITAIGVAASENQKAAQNIKTLQERARRIDKIVDAIVNVTIQTNLLALNGAIEAARAGKHGKGFAVVAGDIRSLARESAEAADKIKTVVRDIQDQIITVARDIEEAGIAAQQQVEEAQRTTNNLLIIQQDTRVVHEAVQQIAAGAEVSLANVQEALAAVGQIAQAAESIAAATAEASAAAEENARGMNELARAVEEIATTAEQLYA